MKKIQIEAIRYSGNTITLADCSNIARIESVLCNEHPQFRIVYKDGTFINVYNAEWVKWSKPFDACNDCGKPFEDGETIYESRYGELCFDCYHKMRFEMGIESVLRAVK